MWTPGDRYKASSSIPDSLHPRSSILLMSLPTEISYMESTYNIKWRLWVALLWRGLEYQRLLNHTERLFQIALCLHFPDWLQMGTARACWIGHRLFEWIKKPFFKITRDNIYFIATLWLSRHLEKSWCACSDSDACHHFWRATHLLPYVIKQENSHWKQANFNSVLLRYPHHIL